MEISKGVAAALAAVCLTVGAAGAYFFSSGRKAARADPIVQVSDVSPDPAAATVEQSEGLIEEAPAESAARPQPAPAVQTRASRRSENRDATTNERAPRSTTGRPGRVEPVEEPQAPPVREEARMATPPALEPIRSIESEVARAPEPPAPQFEELVVSTDSVVGLDVETSITSERARVEDAVVARVMRDVKVGDRVAIPAGSKAHGEVTLVERGGRLKDRARLGIRFTSVVLGDGTRVPLETDTIYREGDAPGGEGAAKIGGGAIGGAIIGGIFGGAKGAAIGGAVGAGAGSGAALASGRNAATLPSGTPVTVRVVKPATVTVEK